MKRSFIIFAAIALTMGLVDRIDTAMSAPGEAIALAFTTIAPAAPILAMPTNWGMTARYEVETPVIQ